MDCRDVRGVLPADEHELQQQLIDMLPSQEGTEAMVALCCSNPYERYLTSILLPMNIIVSIFIVGSCDWDFWFLSYDLLEYNRYVRGIIISEWVFCFW